MDQQKIVNFYDSHGYELYYDLDQLKTKWQPARIAITREDKEFFISSLFTSVNATTDYIVESYISAVLDGLAVINDEYLIDDLLYHRVIKRNGKEKLYRGPQFYDKPYYTLAAALGYWSMVQFADYKRKVLYNHVFQSV